MSVRNPLRHICNSTYLRARLPGLVPHHVKNMITRSATHSANSGQSVQSGSGNVTKDNVVHDSRLKEFYIQLKEGSDDGRAYLQYSHIKPDYVDLEHTVVPSEFRGHGIAKVLAQTAFDHFVEKNTFIRPTCTYLQKFYNENQLPQYTEKVKWDN